MTRGSVSAQAEEIIDAIFAQAQQDMRPLGADELMRAIGLKRTSINSTYAHVNERRKLYNAGLSKTASTDRRSDGRGEAARSKLRTANAQLRRELQAERNRSAQYAKVIRHLALENHQLKNADGAVTDARQRFR